MHVFLSYCHNNKEDVRKLRHELDTAGEQIWWDEDIKPGENWERVIHQAIKNAYAFIACFSKETASRKTLGMYPELRKAIEEFRMYPPDSIFLIPIRLSECTVPNMKIDSVTTLDGLQYLDLFPDEKRDEGLKKLVAAIQEAPYHPLRVRPDEAEAKPTDQAPSATDSASEVARPKSSKSLAYSIENSPIKDLPMGQVVLKVLDEREVLFAPDSDKDEFLTTIRVADNSFQNLPRKKEERSTFSWQVFQPIISGIYYAATSTTIDRGLMKDILEAVSAKCGHALLWGSPATEDQRMDAIFAALKTGSVEDLIVAIRMLCPY